MKGTRIVFRLSPYQLARGLQIIKRLDPEYKLLSLNDIVKTIYHDYIAKMTLNRLAEVPAEIMLEVTSFIESSSSKQLTVDDLIDLKPKPEHKVQEVDLAQCESRVVAHLIQEPEEPKKEIDLSDEILAEINKLAKQPEADQAKASDFNDPNNTDSDISSITDFSPPEDWKE